MIKLEVAVNVSRVEGFQIQFESYLVVQLYTVDIYFGCAFNVSLEMLES